MTLQKVKEFYLKNEEEKGIVYRGLSDCAFVRLKEYSDTGVFVDLDKVQEYTKEEFVTEYYNSLDWLEWCEENNYDELSDTPLEYVDYFIDNCACQYVEFDYLPNGNIIVTEEKF